MLDSTVCRLNGLALELGVISRVVLHESLQIGTDLIRDELSDTTYFFEYRIIRHCHHLSTFVSDWERRKCGDHLDCSFSIWEIATFQFFEYG
jgi:hypothetical protein